MCSLLSSEYVQKAFAAANALNCLLSSHADNARRAVRMGAVALLLQLKARSGGHLAKKGPPFFLAIDKALANLAAAPAPDPAPARCLAPGSRVRITGLQGRPEMNGRTGVICGALQQASMLRSC
jgi:hypothetical protein